MKAILVVLLTLLAVAFAVHPPSHIESESITLTATTTSQVVTFANAYSATPQFAILLAGIELTSASLQSIALIHAYTAVNLTAAEFMMALDADISKVILRWVSTIGEHLQIFPIGVAVPGSSTNIAPALVSVPFDYIGLVSWTALTQNVVVTAVATSFVIISEGSTVTLDATVATWNGTGFYFHQGPLNVVQVDYVMGPAGSITIDNTTNLLSVLIITNMFGGSAVQLTLIFQSVSSPGDAFQTRAAWDQNLNDIDSKDAYTVDLTNSTYNPDNISDTAVRLFGLESIYYEAYDPTVESIWISTTDGLTANNHKVTPSTGDGSLVIICGYYASYSRFVAQPTPPSGCAAGCICDASDVCIKCKRFWAIGTTDADGVLSCPTCLLGFYMTADNICEPCPMTANCDACAIVPPATAPECTGCKCQHHRTLATGACTCNTGYEEASPATAYCVKSVAPGP